MRPTRCTARTPSSVTALREVYAAVDAAIGALIAAAGPDDARRALLEPGDAAAVPRPRSDPVAAAALGHARATRPAARSGARSAADRRANRCSSRCAKPCRCRCSTSSSAACRNGLGEALLCRFMGAIALDVGARAYQVPNNEMNPSVRINLLGRDPCGLVNPGPEYDALMPLPRGPTAALVNPATGGAALADVTISSEVHRGEYRDAAARPDRLLEPRRADRRALLPGLRHDRRRSPRLPHRRTRAAGHGLRQRRAGPLRRRPHRRSSRRPCSICSACPAAPDLDGRSLLGKDGLIVEGGRVKA